MNDLPENIKILPDRESVKIRIEELLTYNQNNFQKFDRQSQRQFSLR